MYFLINIQHTNADEYPCSIFAYSSIDEARAAYHSTLASNYTADLKGFSVVLMNEHGNQIMQEFYNKPEVTEDEE